MLASLVRLRRAAKHGFRGLLHRLSTDFSAYKLDFTDGEPLRGLVADIAHGFKMTYPFHHETNTGGHQTKGDKALHAARMLASLVWVPDGWEVHHEPQASSPVR